MLHENFDLHEKEVREAQALARVDLRPRLERPGYAGTLYQVPAGGTDRTGQEGKQTLRIFEVFTVRLTPDEQKQVLYHIAANPGTHVVLLKPEILERSKGGKVDLVLDDSMGMIPASFIGKKVTIGDNCAAILPGMAAPDISDLSACSELRLSPAGLYRLGVQVEGETLYLVSFNRNRLKKGKFIATPIGGAYEFEGAGGRAVYEQAGIRMKPEEPAKPLEMRQYIAGGDLPKFLELFHAGRGRELTPLRELEEELVGANSEEAVFSALPEDAARQNLNPVAFDQWEESQGYRAPALTSQARIGIAAAYQQNPRLVLEWRLTQELFRALGCDQGRNPPLAELLAEAIVTAASHHAPLGNFLRDDRRSYIVHPLEVALAAVQLGERGPAAVLAALFHDLPEDAGVTIDQLRREIEDKLDGPALEIMSERDWHRASWVVERLTEDVSYRRDRERVYLHGNVALRGRLATKIEHIDRVSQNLDSGSAAGFWRRFEQLEAEDKEVLRLSVLFKVIDRVDNMLTNTSVHNEKQRLMETAEIDRWRRFLSLPLIPERLRGYALHLLEGEEALAKRRSAQDTVSAL